MKSFMKTFKSETLMSLAFLVVIAFFCICFNAWYTKFVVPAVSAKAAIRTMAPFEVVYATQKEPLQTLNSTTAKSNKSADKQYVYYNINLSKELQQYTQDACDVYQIPFELALSIMRVESQYNVDLTNGQKVGLFQIDSTHAKDFCKKLNIEDITTAENNILCGVWHLSKLMHLYGDLHQALMNYEMGPDANKIWETGTTETEYTKAVIACMINFDNKK